MNAEAYLNDTNEYAAYQEFGSVRQSTFASLLNRFDQFKKDAVPSQCDPLDIYCAVNLDLYRVNPILREIERRDFYLYRSNDEMSSWLLLSLTPPKSSFSTKRKFLSLADNLDVASGLVRRGFSKMLPRIGLFKGSEVQTLPEAWQIQAEEEYYPDDLAIVEQEVNEFYPSDDLVNLILSSRKELLAEQSNVLEMLRKDLDPTEFAEIVSFAQADASKTDDQREDVRAHIEQAIRMFVETVGSLSFDQTKAKHFPLTKNNATNFLTSIEDDILRPYILTTASKPRFLQLLLKELTPVAKTGTFRTAHGKLTILNGELVIERQDMKAFDLFSSPSIQQHNVT